MKNLLGGLCLAIGSLMITGVDANPVQALYALAFIGAACACFNWHDKHQAKSDKSAKELSITKKEMEAAA